MDASSPEQPGRGQLGTARKAKRARRLLPLQDWRPPSPRVRRVRKELGKRIKMLLKERGLTWEHLARDCHWQPWKVSGLELGNREVYLSTLVRLADALSIRLESIFKGIK